MCPRDKITSNTSAMGVNDRSRICVVAYRWVIVVGRVIGHVSQFFGLDSVKSNAHFCLIEKMRNIVIFNVNTNNCVQITLHTGGSATFTTVR